MGCNNEFRHVCVKDLDNYIKRDQYFSDYSKEELALVQRNLGIGSSGNPILIKGDYDYIYKQVQESSLKIGYVYVITDFRSIYKDEDQAICGIDNVPSQEYHVFLTPISSNAFDRRVSLYQPNNESSTCQNWVVEYDITPQFLSDEVTSKGTITYLKDTNNNYAYYDFKNIKFKKTAKELAEGPKTYKEDTYLYTFDSDGMDASETTCKNNHLEKGALRNIFLGSTQNVTMAADCHDNIFFKSCENCTFDYGTYGNIFQDDVKRCDGSVHQKKLFSITSSNYPKHFDIVDDSVVIMYLDPQTLTYQVKFL